MLLQLFYIYTQKSNSGHLAYLKLQQMKIPVKTQTHSSDVNTLNGPPMDLKRDCESILCFILMCSMAYHLFSILLMNKKKGNQNPASCSKQQNKSGEVCRNSLYQYILPPHISNFGGQRLTNTLITQDGCLSQLQKIKLLYTENKN